MTAKEQAVADRLSLCHGTLISIPPPEFVSAAADAGFQQVSIRVFSPPQPAFPDHVVGYYPMLGDSQMCRETRLALEDSGVSVVEAEVALVVPDSDVSSFRPIAEAGAYLDARGVMFCFAGQKSEDQLIDQVGAIGVLMAEYRLELLVEFMPLSALKTLDAAARVMDAAGVQNGGIICDTLHLFRSGGTVEDIERVGYGRVSTAQINDGPLDVPFDKRGWAIESVMGRQFLGEGEFPIRDFVEQLPEAIPIGVEVLSKDFQDCGWTATEMARHCMTNAASHLHPPPASQDR